MKWASQLMHERKEMADCKYIYKSIFCVSKQFLNPQEKRRTMYYLLSMAVHSTGMAEDHSATHLQV